MLLLFLGEYFDLHMPGLSEAMGLLLSKLNYSLEVRLNKLISVGSLTQTVTFEYHVLGRIFIFSGFFACFFFNKGQIKSSIYLNVYIDMYYLKNDDYLLVSESKTEIMTITLKCICLFESRQNVNLIWSGLITGRNKEGSSQGSRLLVALNLLWSGCLLCLNQSSGMQYCCP